LAAETITVKADKEALAKVLLDYYAAPGNYALSVGQPVLAFRHLDTVIAWAQGKITDENGLQSASLQQSAVFFVQRACLRQENSHYDVLGIEKNFSLDVLRLRYRALISLTHPDKAIDGFPADAAVRINQAYDTLRDADERAKYDATLSEELKGLPARANVARAPNYALDKSDWSVRLQAYLPNFRKLVFFGLPVLVVALVAVVLAVSQSPTDLQLVEKKGELKSTTTSPSTFAATELPKISADQYADLKEAGGYRVSENMLPLPVSLPDGRASLPTTDKTVATKFIENGALPQTALHNKPHNRIIVAREMVDAVQDTDSTMTPVALAKMQDIEAAKPLLTPVSVPPVAVNAINLKVSGNMPVMSESRRLYAQLNEARFSVTQSISALERPKDAESMQSKMARQGVSGNLFGLVLPHIKQASTVRVDQLALKERLENNRLVLSGSVALWLGSTPSQLIPYKYLVNVEFNDVESGPVMSSFDLKEAK
jgi:DnaJ-domain-containing protein 1